MNRFPQPNEKQMEKIHEWMKTNHWIQLLPSILILGYFIVKWIIEEKKYRIKTKKERTLKGNKFYNFYQEKIEFFVDETPAYPITFGRKINWIVIKSETHEEIVNEFLGKKKIAFRTNLTNGVYGAYASYIFVYPPIKHWVIVIYLTFNIDDDSQLNYLRKLSKKYNEVQFFGSFRGVGYSAWAKFINGEIIRAYSVSDGKIYRNIGAVTGIEEELIKRAIENATEPEEIEWIKGEGKFFCLSSEENVLEVAENWSINPGKLDEYKVEELGTIIEA